MENILIITVVGLLGLCFGSFVNAAVWRIKNNKNLTTDRSECVYCHHKLAWYDLIPVISWLLLKGRCRYCHKPISPQYPIVELVVAFSFTISYLVWPYGMTSIAEGALFGLWLVSLVLLAILFVYDLRWFLLPDKVVYPLIAVGFLMALLRIVTAQGSNLGLVVDAVMAVIVLAGLYLMLFLVSKGRWVGFGDVKLGVFLGLALGHAPLAILCLFLANILGCLYVIPGIATNKLQRDTRVPFGPFLITAFIIAFLWGEQVIDWYLSLTLGL